MASLSLNRSSIFALSHINAKQIRNEFLTYREAFAAALRAMYATIKRLQKQTPEQNKKELLPEVTKTKKARITKVLLHWSESGMFPPEENKHEYKFSEFEHKAFSAAQQNGPVRGNGYAKTKISVFWDNGEVMENIRLDLATDEDTGFSSYMRSIIEFAKTERGRAYYTEKEIEDRLNFHNHYELKDA